MHSHHVSGRHRRIKRRVRCAIYMLLLSIQWSHWESLTMSIICCMVLIAHHTSYRWEMCASRILIVHYTVLLQPSGASVRVHSEIIYSTLNRNLVPWWCDFKHISSVFVRVSYCSKVHDFFCKHRCLELPVQVRLILRAGLSNSLNMRSHV